MSVSGPTTTGRGSPPGLFVRIATILSLGLSALAFGGQDPGDSKAKAQPPPSASARPKAEIKPAPKGAQAAESTTAKKSTSAKPPTIRSKTEADRLKPKSSFLRPPGGNPDDKYGDDDEEVPPWRQTTFFGIRARGQFFIYVLDGSGSMIDEDRFPKATIELRRSVFALQPPQRFEVIFYNERPIPMPGGPTPRPADLKSKTALLQWLRMMEPEGETFAVPAMSQAIALRPDAIFFLSDGVLPDGTVESIAGLNKAKIPIHCIDLTGGAAGDQLRRIAEQNGGTYAARPGSLHASP